MRARIEAKGKICPLVSLVSLTEWYYKIKACDARNIYILKELFNSVDSVQGYTVFNIGSCWTHAEYSKQSNQDKLKCVYTSIAANLIPSIELLHNL